MVNLQLVWANKKWKWCLPHLHHCEMFSSTPDTSVTEQNQDPQCLSLSVFVPRDVWKWHTCCRLPSAAPYQITSRATVRSCVWKACVRVSLTENQLPMSPQLLWPRRPSTWLHLPALLFKGSTLMHCNKVGCWPHATSACTSALV